MDSILIPLTYYRGYISDTPNTYPGYCNDETPVYCSGAADYNPIDLNPYYFGGRVQMYNDYIRFLNVSYNGTYMWTYARVDHENYRLYVPTLEELQNIPWSQWVDLYKKGGTYIAGYDEYCKPIFRNEAIFNKDLSIVTHEGGVTKWVYDGKGYEFAKLYNSDVDIALILGDIIYIVAYPGDTSKTSNNAYTYGAIRKTSSNNAGFYRLISTDDKYWDDEGTFIRDWNDREVLYVDGIKWSPEHERVGEKHKGPESPCGEVKLQQVGYVCTETQHRVYNMTRRKKYEVLYDGVPSGEYVVGTRKLWQTWMDLEDCQTNDSFRQWIPDPENGIICELEKIYHRMVMADIEGNILEPAIYKADLSRYIKNCKDCQFDRTVAFRVGDTNENHNFFGPNEFWTGTAESHDCGDTFEVTDIMLDENKPPTYPRMTSNVRLSNGLRDYSMNFKNVGNLYQSHVLSGERTLNGVLADALYVGPYEAEGIYSGFVLGFEDSIVYICNQVCGNWRRWTRELPFDEEVLSLITSPKTLNFQQYYIDTYPCNEIHVFGHTEDGFKLCSCQFPSNTDDTSQWTKTSVTPSVPITGDVWATLINGDYLLILTSDYFYSLNRDGSLNLMTQNGLVRRDNHPIIFNSKTGVLYTAYYNYGINVWNGDMLAVWESWRDYWKCSPEPFVPQTYQNLVSNHGCELTLMGETENKDYDVQVKSTYVDFFGYTWLGEYYTTNPDYTAKFVSPIVELRNVGVDGKDSSSPEVYYGYVKYFSNPYRRIYPIGYMGAYSLYIYTSYGETCLSFDKHNT